MLKIIGRIGIILLFAAVVCGCIYAISRGSASPAAGNPVGTYGNESVAPSTSNGEEGSSFNPGNQGRGRPEGRGHGKNDVSGGLLTLLKNVLVVGAIIAVFSLIQTIAGKLKKAELQRG